MVCHESCWCEGGRERKGVRMSTVYIKDLSLLPGFEKMSQSDPAVLTGNLVLVLFSLILHSWLPHPGKYRNLVLCSVQSAWLDIECKQLQLPMRLQIWNASAVAPHWRLKHRLSGRFRQLMIISTGSWFLSTLITLQTTDQNGARPPTCHTTVHK